MAKSSMSIIGLYNWDSTIFTDFNVPTGLDKDTAIETILFNCAELEVLYPNPTVMKAAIKNWSAINQSIWTKLYATTNLTYNPIYNKDGVITETEIVTNDKSGSSSSLANGISNNQQGGTDSQLNQVAAFNGTSMVDSTQNTETVDLNSQVTNTSTGSSTTESDEEMQRSWTRTETGNIGITTTQQMIREEREVDLFNCYQFISDSFKARFCLGVY